MLKGLAYLPSILAIALACRGRDGSDRATDTCRELGQGYLRGPSLVIHVDSKIERDGTVRAGAVPSCGARARATELFVAAHEALGSAPTGLRPESVVVHLAPELPADAPALGILEVHRPSRSVLVTGLDAAISRPMWLHEFAHLLMLGQAPEGRAARSLHGAIEEGIADYYAACVQGSPALGPGGDAELARDLRARPRGVGSGWEALAVPNRRFDEHRFGWDLAAMLWKREPRTGPLLEDLLRCVAEVRYGTERVPPRQVMRALLVACPPRSRDRVEAILSSWLPDALQPAR